MKCHHIALMLVVGLSLLDARAAVADSSAPRFDGRAWSIGNRQQNSSRSITEYVLPGETVDHWSELVTSQVFRDPDHRMPLKFFLSEIRASLERGCSSLVWHTIRQDDESVIFEWHDAGCGGFEAQAELDRVAVGPQGVHRLAYAVYTGKAKDALNAKKRDAWIALLATTPFVEGAGDPADNTAAAQRSPSGQPATDLQTRALVGIVARSGSTCVSGVRAEKIEERDGIGNWHLQCSGNLSYTVLLDPTGGATVVRDK
jgi:hypothetical protein